MVDIPADLERAGCRGIASSPPPETSARHRHSARRSPRVGRRSPASSTRPSRSSTGTSRSTPGRAGCSSRSSPAQAEMRRGRSSPSPAITRPATCPTAQARAPLDRIVISAARELGPRGISANVLNPGPIDTGWMTDEVRSALTGMQPGGRLGGPPTSRRSWPSWSRRGAVGHGAAAQADGGFSISI